VHSGTECVGWQDPRFSQPFIICAMSCCIVAARISTEDAIRLTELSNFAESWLPFDSKMAPIFWHIPKAGGSSVKDAIGSCHRHMMETEFGVTDGHGGNCHCLSQGS
jgi:hypothetical protein